MIKPGCIVERKVFSFTLSKLLLEMLFTSAPLPRSLPFLPSLGPPRAQTWLVCVIHAGWLSLPPFLVPRLDHSLRNLLMAHSLQLTSPLRGHLLWEAFLPHPWQSPFLSVPLLYFIRGHYHHPKVAPCLLTVRPSAAPTG